MNPPAPVYANPPVYAQSATYAAPIVSYTGDYSPNLMRPIRTNQDDDSRSRSLSPSRPLVGVPSSAVPSSFPYAAPPATYAATPAGAQSATYAAPIVSYTSADLS